LDEKKKRETSLYGLTSQFTKRIVRNRAQTLYVRPPMLVRLSL
jgi:hypothetical protein